ncbi:MAG TPA: hypothetical protein VHZ24_10760 [Pirellulales bacterium]|jgi:hypothetical protein|nr:hypothetical protein [Pirellulales bacterium]
MQAYLRARSVLALAGMLLALAGSVRAAPGSGGSASRAARDEALRALPLAKLPPEPRARLAKVVNDTTIFRHLPTQVIECDPTFYLFLVEHPEVVVNVWRVLGISDVRLDRTEDNILHANDGAGTTGDVEMAYHSHDVHVFYAAGRYDGPIFPRPMQGQCVLLLRTSYVRETNGKYHVTCRLDSFLHIENATLEMLGKVMQPFVGQIADHNFRETTLFVSGLNQAAECNLTGIQEVSARMKEVRPEIRHRFVELSEQLAVQAALAETAAVHAAAREQTGQAPRTSRRPSTDGATAR